MSEGCVIRKIRKGDREEWLRMRWELWPDCSEERHLREVKETLSLPEIRLVLVLARDQGGLGGFIEVQIRKGVNNAASKLVGYIEGWYVDNDLRREGWGRKLMAAAEDWAAEHGLTEIASDTDVENDISIEAHHELGFEESYRLVHFLKDIEPRKRKD